jgi:hypothetical protein
MADNSSMKLRMISRKPNLKYVEKKVNAIAFMSLCTRLPGCQFEIEKLRRVRTVIDEMRSYIGFKKCNLLALNINSLFDNLAVHK